MFILKIEINFSPSWDVQVLHKSPSWCFKWVAKLSFIHADLPFKPLKIKINPCFISVVLCLDKIQC